MNKYYSILLIINILFTKNVIGNYNSKSNAYNYTKNKKDSLQINTFKKNRIELSLIGESVSFSLNYQRHLIRKNYFNLGLSIGFGNFAMNINQYSNPLFLNVDIGKKHNLTTSIGINNIYNTKPYPETKAERKEFIKNRPLPYDMYYPTFNQIYFTSFGYKYIGTKGLIISPELTLMYYRQSQLFNFEIFYLPKIKIGYAF
jgi:hypothetical protein